MGSRIVAVLVYLAVCIGFGAYGWRSVRDQERAPAEWTPVPARVVSATMKVKERHGEYHTVSYIPRLAYAYEIAGETHRGDRLYLFQRWNSEDRTEADAMLARFPVGGSVTAYVDPRDPGQAVLFFDASSVPYVLCLVAAVFAALAIVALLMPLPGPLRAAGLLSLTLGWYALLAWAVLHWYRVCTVGWWGWVVMGSVFCIFAGLGLVPLLMTVGSLMRRSGR